MLKSSTTSLKTNETIPTQNNPSINNSIKTIEQQSPFRCIKSIAAHNNKIVSLKKSTKKMKNNNIILGNKREFGTSLNSLNNNFPLKIAKKLQ